MALACVLPGSLNHSHGFVVVYVVIQADCLATMAADGSH